MLGLGLADIVTLVVYFVVVTGLGVWAARTIKGTKDFFMAGNRFGKAMMIMHAFGSGTHTDQAVSVASKTYSSGMSGIWYQWLYLPVTPFYWLVAPIFRRLRALTTGDYFHLRFNSGVALLFAVIGMMQMMTTTGIILKGMGEMMVAVTGAKVSLGLAIGVMSAILLVYGVAGGLAAVIITDFIQGFLIIILSFILVPPVLGAVGGFSGLHSQLNQIDSKLLNLTNPGDITVFYVVMIAINALVGLVTQPHIMGNCAAGKSEFEGRVGLTYGNFIKRICTVAWMLVGMCAIVLYRDLEHPDRAFGMAARKFLPGIMPGMLGIFVACSLAAVMSSCDSFMIASSALFTENIYKPFIRKDASEKHYVLVGRLASFIIVAGGIIYAFKLKSVIKGLETFWKIAAMLGVAWWAGLFWRRFNSIAAWVSTLSAFCIWWLTTQQFFLKLLPESMVTISSKEGVESMAIYLPWQMLLYLSCGLILGIIASLLTKPQPKEQLDRFYSLIATPVMAGEAPSGIGMLPEGMEAVKPRKLIDSENLEIYVPARGTLIGFAICWLVVFAMIGGLLLLMGIGA